jgi:putative transposase
VSVPWRAPCAATGALRSSTPTQGSQYTGAAFTGVLKAHQITLSMDGKGRAMDNIMVERLWRSVKYEEVYIKDYRRVAELVQGLKAYFEFYNHERPHQSFGGQLRQAGQVRSDGKFRIILV